jgi:cytochrome b561
MNNWCICWFLTHFFLGILIFKGLTVRLFYKSFGVKRLTAVYTPTYPVSLKLFSFHLYLYDFDFHVVHVDA